MESLESLVNKMESQMDRADSKLDFLSMRLDQFESKVLLSSNSSEGIPTDGENNMKGEETPSEKEDTDDDSGLDPKLVTELLVEVKRVKKEYDQLLQDLHQVQELQHEVTRSLRNQMKQVQNHFDQLRDKIIGSSGSNVVPTNK